MAKMSVLLSAATALSLLGAQSAVAQHAPPPLYPGFYINYYSWSDLGNYTIPIDREPALISATCADGDRMWEQRLAQIFGGMEGAALPDGTYTVTVNIGPCQGSDVFAHNGNGWFPMFFGPRGGSDSDHSEDAD